MARKSTGKRERFEIFKRDGFTCQYCGAQPPDIVLVIDHIVPVSKGGSDEMMNKITACEPCNQGKADKELGNVAPRPDADTEWLSMQQEIKELERFQLAKHKRDNLIVGIADDLTDQYLFHVGIYYDKDRTCNEIFRMLTQYDPEMVEEALMVTATRVRGEYVDKWEWNKYTYGILRNMKNER